MLFRSSPWVLAESEGHKAGFLFQSSRELGLTSVKVVADRGENFLVENSVDSVVARAVGPVERIFGWIEGCATWNSLVLLKGRGWAEEWASFNQGKFKGRLSVERSIEYSVGAEEKKRFIIKLVRA